MRDLGEICLGIDQEYQADDEGTIRGRRYRCIKYVGRALRLLPPNDAEHWEEIMPEPAAPLPAGNGSASPSLRRHVHLQASPAQEWTLNHNFGEMPSVAVIDNIGNEVEAEVAHVSLNQTRVRFSGSHSGTARCV